MAAAATQGTPDPDWSWPPYAPWESDDARYRIDEWAPPSTVRRPWLRLWRWTVLYKRGA